MKNKYKKIGGGILEITINKVRKKIRNGEIFEADVEEIRGFEDVLQLVESKEEEKKEESNNESLKIVKKGKYYYVVNATCKAFNEKPLTKKEAEELKKSLEL